VRDEPIHDFFEDELIPDSMTLVLDAEGRLSIKHNKNGMIPSHSSSSLLIHRIKRTLKGLVVVARRQIELLHSFFSRRRE
jgi:hypothetical protein